MYVPFYVHWDSGMQWWKRECLVNLNFTVDPQHEVSVKSISRDESIYSYDLTTHLFSALCFVLNK
jgi:hypothetical protein